MLLLLHIIWVLSQYDLQYIINNGYKSMTIILLQVNFRRNNVAYTSFVFSR